MEEGGSDKKVDVDFEFHPPIDQDLDGIAALLRQTLLNFVDCNSLAKRLIDLRDLTQVIALGTPTQDGDNDDEEPDNDIYGVSSVIDLPTNSGERSQPQKELIKLLQDKCPKFRQISNSSDQTKLGLIINERYINLPPQLALPALKGLTSFLEESQFSHLVLVGKILLKARSKRTELPSKKTKSGESSVQNVEPLVFINPEEEIICENSIEYTDFDVSSHCDENAAWSPSSDIKYIPHRRIMIIDYNKWSTILKELDKELQRS